MVYQEEVVHEESKHEAGHGKDWDSLDKVIAMHECRN